MLVNPIDKTFMHRSYRDPLLLGPLRAALAPPAEIIISSSIITTASRRQRRRRAALLLLAGRELLPRLLRDGGLDAAPLGQVLPPFPSARDALVRVFVSVCRLESAEHGCGWSQELIIMHSTIHAIDSGFGRRRGTR